MTDGSDDIFHFPQVKRQFCECDSAGETGVTSEKKLEVFREKEEKKKDLKDLKIEAGVASVGESQVGRNVVT